MRHDLGPKLRSWLPSSEIEPSALAQLQQTASCPWVVSVAAMSDVHAGKGATVGSVVVTKNAVQPACVGVDIGCGVEWRLTTLSAADLPTSLEPLRAAIEAAIPTSAGSQHDEPVDVGPLVEVDDKEHAALWAGFKDVAPVADGVRARRQLGTLGSGNHHIELCVDNADGRVSLLLHSGSRGVGNTLASHHIAIARRLAHNADLPDRDLAAFLSGTPEMAAYRRDLYWSQDYARLNRQVMMSLLRGVCKRHLPPFEIVDSVSCHHNFVAEETFAEFGNEPVFVTRKGAIASHAGQRGVIPGAMGRNNYVVRGRGLPDSFCSSSHGAGRRMSRNEARRRFTADDLVSATVGVSCRKDARIIDEHPDAYKDIVAVMKAQEDLVEVERVFKSVLTVKGD